VPAFSTCPVEAIGAASGVILRIGLILVFLLNCSHNATLTLRDASIVEGKIEMGDRDAVRVATDAETLNIQRTEIIKIKHPGKAAMVLGAAVFTLGVLGGVMAIAQGECREGCALPVQGILLPAAALATGFSFFAWGYSAWSTSNAAYEQRPPDLGQNAGGGLGVKYRF
jgi:hypothetical protein